jgi:hypothetical protein
MAGCNTENRTWKASRASISVSANRCRGSQPPSARNSRAYSAYEQTRLKALVNDQLGRLRAIFGDPRIVGLFKKWAQRPPRFARYTSRTPYAFSVGEIPEPTRNIP